MISYFIFVNILIGVYGQSDSTAINPSNCGERPFQPANDPLKIVGGTVAKAGDFGWQASLMYMTGFTCGASLINSEWIITGKRFNK